MKKTVLLADPDIGMQLLLSRLLLEDGYAVLTAGDGAEAIARLETHQPDLLVANASLPGKSGAELCHFVKSAHSPIPVVILSPGPDAQVPEADATITLPIDPQNVLETIQGILERAESGEPPPSRLLIVDDDLGDSDEAAYTWNITVTPPPDLCVDPGTLALDAANPSAYPDKVDCRRK